MIHDSPLNKCVRLAASCLITLSLIACGGGAKEPLSDTPATPTSKDPAPIVAPSSKPFLIATTSTTEGTSGKKVEQFIIIDASTHQVVRQIQLRGDRLEWDNPGAVSRYTTDLESNTRGEDGYRAVYFIENGKVFRQDLSQAPLPAAKQISNTGNACGLKVERLDSTEFELVTVITRNASNTCDLLDINQQIRITSEMTESDSGVPMLTVFVGGFYNSPKSFTPSQLIFYNPQQLTLVLYSKDLKSSLPPVEIAPVYRPLEIFFDRKTNTNILKAENELYPLSITNNALVIGAPVSSSSGAKSVQTVLSSLDQTFILFEGNILEQFEGSSQPTKHLSNIGTNGDFVVQLSRQQESLIAAGFRSESANLARVFYRVHLNDGTVETAGTSPIQKGECFYTFDGDHAWLFTCNQDQKPDLQTLFKRSVKTLEVQPLISDVIVIGVLTSEISTSRRMTHLIYCRPMGSRNDCAGAPIMSRNMVTNQEVAIGQYQADAQWLSSTATIFDALDSGDRLVLQTWNQTSDTASHTDTWTFSPNQANSLIKVSVPH